MATIAYARGDFTITAFMFDRFSAVHFTLLQASITTNLRPLSWISKYMILSLTFFFHLAKNRGFLSPFEASYCFRNLVTFCLFFDHIWSFPACWKSSLKYIVDEKTRRVFSLSQGKANINGSYFLIKFDRNENLLNSQSTLKFPSKYRMTFPCLD